MVWKTNFDRFLEDYVAPGVAKAGNDGIFPAGQATAAPAALPAPEPRAAASAGSVGAGGAARSTGAACAPIEVCDCFRPETSHVHVTPCVHPCINVGRCPRSLNSDWKACEYMAHGVITHPHVQTQVSGGRGRPRRVCHGQGQGAQWWRAHACRAQHLHLHLRSSRPSHTSGCVCFAAAACMGS